MANTTDKSILTAAGKALLAQLNAEEKPLIIDKMIFANVPNRPEFPQPDDVVPTDHIVHQEGVEQRGRLSADSVIYSTTLTSDVGPFEFNWTGAYCSEYGVLVTIDHHALTPKSADEPGVAGNTLVRSVVLEYKDIAEITNITVDASSWQYNATPRMKKMDDDVAQAIIDQNGKDWFIEDGFLVTPQASAFNIKAGAGYVSGNRVSLEFDRNVQVPNKPSFIYVDAHREGTPTGEQVTLFDFVVTAEEKDDYTDANGVKHYVCKIAQVLADGSVSDLRPEGESKNKPYLTFEDFGCKGYPSDDTEGFERIQNYLDSLVGILPVIAKKPVYLTRKGLVIRSGKSVEGVGCDYWDTWRPNQNELLKSMKHGTTILFAGSGERKHSAINLDDNTPPKEKDGVICELLKFNNGDSIDGRPATPKMFSVGVVVERNASLKNIRLVPEFEGIDGYNDFTTDNLAADWDVGIWFQGANEASCENVQSVGYWRMAGTLFTENNGTFEQIANPERCVINRLRTQGVRGISVRNSAQWKTFDDSYSNNSITCEYNQYWTLTSQNKFRLIGPYQIYEFTGYQVSADGEKITLTGVTPDLPDERPEILRSPSMGNNLAGTIFNDSVFTSFEHSSGKAAVSFGLPEAAAFEISGFPLRGLKLNNTKAQTTWDNINGIFADCRDLRWHLSQFENGLLVAYGEEETIGHTINLRLPESYANSGALDRALFNPRGYFNSYDAFPTEFSDGNELVIRHPLFGVKGLSTKIMSSHGKVRYHIEDLDSYLATERNFEIKKDSGESLMSLYGESKNVQFYGSVLSKGELISESNTRSSKDGVNTCGTPSYRYSDGFFINTPIGTSDENEKEIEVIPQAWIIAANNIKPIRFRWKDEIEKFKSGERKQHPRWHIGYGAQSVFKALQSAGVVNPWECAFLCKDALLEELDTGEVVPIVDEKGNQVERWGIRQTELNTLKIAAISSVVGC
ncbi:phage tail-collar fiber domain-containing protein [Vibrio diabolicus]|uniref:phage tail-collar fiber domain-containing protein n=1 Tax=Vibrio diabolicus TaxID=50719 RepID=UPI001E4A56D4|nr:phage tail protein [Vibrio diabolicus]